MKNWPERLKKQGGNETKASIANKLARATVPAAFFSGLGGNRMRRRVSRRCLILSGLLIASSVLAQSNQSLEPKPGSAASETKNNEGQTSSIGDQQKLSRDQNDRSQEIDADWWMVRLTGVIGAIGFLQLWVFGLQARRLRQTVEKMDEVAAGQTRDMRDSIAEAAKAAVAMDKVAGSLKINADKIIESVEINKEIGERQQFFGKMQLRAYVCAVIGGAVYQERDKQLLFQAITILRNFGGTPAHNVKWRARAAILPVQIPRDFKFTLPKEAPGSFLIPPHQGVEIFAVIDGFVPDEEIDSIKQRDGKALYVWGTASYRDAFRKIHRLTFFHQLYWAGSGMDEVTRGVYLAKHNKAN